MGAPAVGIGSVLGGYRLVGRIGAGGMGEIYQGQNVRLERMVRAIKVIRPELSADPKFRERFLREADFLELLHHPNILRIEHLDEQDGVLFLVMELLHGATVDALVKVGALPVEKAVDIATQGLLGVAHAHSNGIIHRDLKPANLFRLDSGLVKVLDFGIARANSSENATLTGTSQMTPGSPAYFAPEYADGGRATAASDVYAMCITLYQMLAGKLPFLPGGDSDTSGAVSLLLQHATRPLPDLRQFCPGLPDELVAAIVAAAAKRPADRPDALTFARMLAPFGNAVIAAQVAAQAATQAMAKAESRADDLSAVRAGTAAPAAADGDLLGQRTTVTPAKPMPRRPANTGSGVEIEAVRSATPSPLPSGTLAGQGKPSGGLAGKLLLGALVAVAGGGVVLALQYAAGRKPVGATPTPLAVASVAPTSTVAPTITVAPTMVPARTATPVRTRVATATPVPTPAIISTPLQATPKPTPAPTREEEVPVGLAFIKVSSFPTAEVYLDTRNQSLGVTPLLKLREIKSGSHTLILRGMQCDEMRVPFSVAPGATWAPGIFYLNNCKN